jgi:hypothetical protein
MLACFHVTVPNVFTLSQELGNGPEYSALEVDQGNGWS